MAEHEVTKRLRLPDYDRDGIEAYVIIRDPLYVTKKSKGFWDIVKQWQQAVREERLSESDDIGDELVLWFVVDFEVPGVSKSSDLPSVILNAIWQTEVLQVLNPTNLRIEKV